MNGASRTIAHNPNLPDIIYCCVCAADCRLVVACAYGASSLVAWKRFSQRQLQCSLRTSQPWSARSHSKKKHRQCRSAHFYGQPASMKQHETASALRV